MQRSSRVQQQLRCQLRCVHADLDYRSVDDGSGVRVRVSETVTEIVSALLDDDEVCECISNVVASHRVGEVAGDRDDPVSCWDCRDDTQCVEQSGGSDFGSGAITDVCRQARLRQPWYRCLRHHQNGEVVVVRCSNHPITFQKSRIARIVPNSDPDTFEWPAVRLR